MKRFLNLIKRNRYVSILCILTLIISMSVVWFTRGDAIFVNSSQEGIPLPIIMYHSVLKSPKTKTKYIVTPAQLEEDMIYLQNNGYTTITMSDLIDYVYLGTPLPEKPVMLTFDDGYYNNYTYVFPLLKKYQMKAVISVVGTYCEIFSESMDLNPNYAHLTWDNIKEMSESGLVEFQNHSYNMHSTEKRKGCCIMAGEDYVTYKSVLCSDVLKLQTLLAEKCGIVPNTFTYPYGAICDESEQILKELGFVATLSCYERMNYITQSEDCLFSLNRFNRDSSLTTYRFREKIR